MAEERITLATIGGGAAPELFERELHRVLANIHDVNTPAKAIREISIRVWFHPDENREAAETTLEVKSKLAGVKKIRRPVFLGISDGEHIAVQSNPRQGRIFDPAPSAVDMNAVDRQIKDVHDR